MQDQESAPIPNQAGFGRTLVAALVGLVYFFPVIWMILAAFKTRADALATPPKLFFTPTLEHFWASFHRVSTDGSQVFDTGLDRNFANSLFISLVSVTLALALGALAAYGFARLRIVGRDYFMFYILVLRMVPPITAIVPLYVLFRVTGLGGGYVAIILVYTAFNLPFAIWMLRSFHRRIAPADRRSRAARRQFRAEDFVAHLPASNASRNRGDGDHRLRIYVERFSIQPTVDERRHPNRSGGDDAGRRRGCRRGLGRVRRHRHDLSGAGSPHRIFSAKSVAARRPPSARCRDSGPKSRSSASDSVPARYE